MDKATLIKKIEEGKYTTEQLLGWVKCLPGNSLAKKPAEYRVGDVLMHPVFQHPYVLLEQGRGHWVAGLLTTEETCEEILCEAESRFFPGNHFTRIIFTVKEPTGTFLNVFENLKQLREVLVELRKTFSAGEARTLHRGATRPATVTPVAEVPPSGIVETDI
jgi:hypothetical protein